MQAISVQTPSGARAFHYRPGSSDEQVIRQVFGEKHYALDVLNRNDNDIPRLLRRIAANGQRPLVIDAGANIGATSVEFACMFPGARVIAVEPEAGNYSMLLQNTEGLDVQCLPAAIGSHTGRTRIVDPGIGHWGYRTNEAASGSEVAMVSIPQILQSHGGPEFRPFLAKIDIEGGESELFAGDTSWVNLFPILIVELHDWLIPGGHTALPFLRCIAALDRDFVCFRENVFSIDNAIAR